MEVLGARAGEYTKSTPLHNTNARLGLLLYGINRPKMPAFSYKTQYVNPHTATSTPKARAAALAMCARRQPYRLASFPAAAGAAARGTAREATGADQRAQTVLTRAEERPEAASPPGARASRRVKTGLWVLGAAAALGEGAVEGDGTEGQGL